MRDRYLIKVVVRIGLGGREVKFGVCVYGEFILVSGVVCLVYWFDF